jgi:hypothetical protein
MPRLSLVPPPTMLQKHGKQWMKSQTTTKTKKKKNNKQAPEIEQNRSSRGPK